MAALNVAWFPRTTRFSLQLKFHFAKGVSAKPAGRASRFYG